MGARQRGEEREDLDKSPKDPRSERKEVLFLERSSQRTTWGYHAYIRYRLTRRGEQNDGLKNSPIYIPGSIIVNCHFERLKGVQTWMNVKVRGFLRKIKRREERWDWNVIL